MSQEEKYIQRLEDDINNWNEAIKDMNAKINLYFSFMISFMEKAPEHAFPDNIKDGLCRLLDRKNNYHDYLENARAKLIMAQNMDIKSLRELLGD